MNRVLFILLLFLCGAAEASQYTTFTQQEKDSLCAHIRKIEADTARLDYIVKLAISKQNTDDFLFLSNLLLEESVRQNNLAYEAKALYYHIVYHYNHDNLKEATEWKDRMKPKALEAKMYYEYFNGQRFVIDLYSMNEAYEFAVDEASRMMEEAEKLDNPNGKISAYSSIGTAYLGSGRLEEGAQMLEKAYQLIDKENPISTLEITLQLTSTYDLLNNNEKVLTYCNMLSDAMEKIRVSKNGSIEGYNDIYLYMNIMKANIYIRKKELADATLYKDSATLYYVPEKTYYMYRIVYLGMCRDYNLLTGDTEKALAANEEALALTKEQYPQQYLELMTQKADILMECGKAEEALALYQEIIPRSTRLTTQVSDKQLKQIQHKYNLEQATLQKEKNKTTLRRITLLFALFVLLTLFISLIKLQRIREELQASKKETEEATYIVEKSNELKSIFLKNISHEIRTPLNAVVGFSDLLSTEQSSRKEISEYSNIVKRNSDLLIRLINDILDLSRLESGMMRFNLADHDVETICDEVVHSLERTPDTELNFTFPENLKEHRIHTDSVRLTDTIKSTLSSPYKKSTPGRVDLHLSVNAKKEQLILTIAGSPLADPFTPTQSTKMRNELNRLVIERMGGQYEILPETKEGPTIVITYPMV